MVTTMPVDSELASVTYSNKNAIMAVSNRRLSVPDENE
jgi:hypothetical protein